MSGFSARELRALNERLKEARAFEDRVYSDEPIVRRGMPRSAKPAEAPSVRRGMPNNTGIPDKPAVRRESPQSTRVPVEPATQREMPRSTGTPAEPVQREVPRYTDVSDGSDMRWGRLVTPVTPVEPAPRREIPHYANVQDEPIPWWKRTDTFDERPRRIEMPKRYRELRSLARGRSRMRNSYISGPQLFYKQAKLMEDFEDDFEGTSTFRRFYPTYDEMGDYDLRVYFSWRTRVRHKEFAPAPKSFIYVHIYELLCSIGAPTKEAGLEAMRELRDHYAQDDPTLAAHLRRWMHDYVVTYELDPALAETVPGSFPYASVALLQRAEKTLLAQQDPSAWPEKLPEGLASSEELLDALMGVSRYRADRSRFIKQHREDVAWVTCRVFSQMVAHCHKRRKTDYLEGLFGPPTRMSYTMFPSAIFWSPEPHPDTTFVLAPSERYVCKNGFWSRELPCRRMETSKEVGQLLHAIDCRMRESMGDPHPLKARSLPKYQAKFVDTQIEALLELRKAEEEARIVIDRSALRDIRSAATRTREALLTDDEREDVVPAMSAAPAASVFPTVPEFPVEFESFSPPQEDEAPAALVPEKTAPLSQPSSDAAAPSSVPGLTAEQVAVLSALVNGEVPPAVSSGAFLSLTVDAINEYFLDELGDTVVEFDGEGIALVEDYLDDVREILGL